MPRGDQGLNMTAISSGVLKTQVVSFFFAFFPLASLSFGDEISLERGRELAQRFLVVDTHIDFPFRLLEQSAKSAKPRTGPQVKPSFNPASRETLIVPAGDFDAARAKKGGLDAAWMSIYVPASAQTDPGSAKALADRIINIVEGIAKESPEVFTLVKTASEVEAVAKAGKIALPLGIENGAAIEDDLANLKHFFDRGVRYITLTHSEDNRICDSSYTSPDKRTWHGLSPFGRRVVLEMNRLVY